MRLIFSWIALERCSIVAVCRRLKEKGILSPRGKNYWDRSTVWGILQNPAYIGKAQFGKTRVGPAGPRCVRNGASQRNHGGLSRSTIHRQRSASQLPCRLWWRKLCSRPPPSNWVRIAAADAKASARRRYLLQGLLVCGQCGYAYYGKPLSRSASKGKPRDYAYYRCVGCDAYRFGGQRICKNKQCRTDQLDKAVWTDVCSPVGRSATPASRVQASIAWPG